MESPGLPLNEAERLQCLEEHQILDTPPEPAFDNLVELTAHILDAPIVLVSLVSAERQWFKACLGLDVRETPRAISFCGHVVEGDAPLEVRDALQDPRFADNPLVVGGPLIRFYAGQPLRTSEGYVLGTLCVVDQQPRSFSEQQHRWHEKIARQVADQLERRRHALLLQDEKRKLGALFGAMAEGVVIQDRLGRITRNNPAAERILGLSAEQIAGRSSLDPAWSCCRQDGSPFPGEDHPAMEALRTGQPVRDVIMGVRRGGGLTWITINALPMAGAEDDNDDAVVTTFHDITERINAEDVRRARLVDAILSNLPGSSLAIFDQALVIQERFWVNEGHGGESPGEPRKILDWAPADRQGALREAALRCLGGEPAQLDIFRGKTHLDLRLMPLPSEVGQTPRGLALAYDVTERDELRERVARQERLATTGTLAAGVGHEINNPLTFIVTNLEFALEELRSVGGGSPAHWISSMIEVLNEAHEGAERIRKIVRGLRSFAHEENEPAPTSALAAVDISLSMARHEIRHKASLSLKLDPVPQVLADESRLAQILVNLLVNAAQAFTTSDPTRNQITVQTQLLSDGRVAVEVSDNGPGIAPEVLPRIFDPFFTTKPPGRGTGLGLAICGSIVRGFGGEIVCETEVGVGTTFRVVLVPAQVNDAPSGRQGAVRKLVGRVLVIDDEESMLKVFVRLLQGNHEVVALSDPRDALRRIEAGEHFDVVFCDIMMPHLTGIELFGKIQQNNPALAGRFVFMSGGVLGEEVRAFLQGIPNEFVDKPFNSHQIRSIVLRHIPAG